MSIRKLLLYILFAICFLVISFILLFIAAFIVAIPSSKSELNGFAILVVFLILLVSFSIGLYFITKRIKAKKIQNIRAVKIKLNSINDDIDKKQAILLNNEMKINDIDPILNSKRTQLYEMEKLIEDKDAHLRNLEEEIIEYQNFINDYKLLIHENKINSLDDLFLRVDQMCGEDFEVFVGQTLEHHGFSNITYTPATNDYGVDLLAFKENIKYAIQCKRYSTTVGSAAVQEVVSGIAYYKCDKGVVVTNNFYTTNALNLAQANNIDLIDKTELAKMLWSILHKSDNNDTKKEHQELIKLKELYDMGIITKEDYILKKNEILGIEYK